MNIVNVPNLTFYEKLADKLMKPIMFVLRGYKTDSLQETHKWHVYNIDPKRIDLSLAVENHGKDKSKYSIENKASFLFHAPILGGFRDFSVYEVNQRDAPFYVGWIVYRSSDNELLKAQVQKLPIKSSQIRLLDGTSKSWGYFFALNKDGNQIIIKKIGAGSIGDKSYTNVKLF
jgi:hypothetical protein